MSIIYKNPNAVLHTYFTALDHMENAERLMSRKPPDLKLVASALKIALGNVEELIELNHQMSEAIQRGPSGFEDTAKHPPH